MTIWLSDESNETVSAPVVVRSASTVRVEPSPARTIIWTLSGAAFEPGS